ncbi:uncharacterized protein LOC109606137 isoform X2 [Aethina tumida]|uniref:uncharacterized protein LOC109606137 isoform X2 n=1 Tax=Aethina tumida TaxID=116153 RepID=UPI002147F8FC|nr:uncharacterized protein LOC109606137 isoform X2 [Aethina tumida]
MSGDIQHLSVFLYILCFEIVIINSKTSYVWRLSEDKTKIVEVKLYEQDVGFGGGPTRLDIYPEDDPLFQILVSTEHDGKHWIKKAPDTYYCTNCHQIKNESSSSDYLINNVDEDPLDCGKPVNFTFYDTLVGVLNRKRHPHIPEPQAIQIFNVKTKNKQPDLDVDSLEKKLRKARKEKPKSVQLYNQIGQFWRIKGDTEKAIECFRRALAVSPHNSDVLLNLARVLFALQYLDDAIYLTRRSLEVLNSVKGAWQQYFTLGEIFKAYGHYQEAMVHLRHTLELKPGFEPALVALREMENMPASTVHVYTLVIIACLVLGVLLAIVSSKEGAEDCEVRTHHRHFNKAIAMRSLRFSVPQKRKKGTS